MAAQAEAANYYILRMGRNSSVQFRYTTISTVRYYNSFPQQQQQDTLSPHQAIFALIVTLLLNFLQLKYQGKDKSPFETRPNTTLFALISLILYCLSCDPKLRISGHHPSFIQRLVLGSMAFLGPLSLASLSSILFPESLCPLLFSLSILFSSRQLMQSHIKKLWDWLKAVVMNRIHHQPQRYRRGLLSVQLPLLPQLVIRDELDMHGILPV